MENEDQELQEITSQNDESIRIANEVVASIAGVAVSEVPRSFWYGRWNCRWNFRSIKWEEKFSKRY